MRHFPTNVFDGAKMRIDLYFRKTRCITFYSKDYTKEFDIWT